MRIENPFKFPFKNQPNPKYGNPQRSPTWLIEKTHFNFTKSIKSKTSQNHRPTWLIDGENPFQFNFVNQIKNHAKPKTKHKIAQTISKFSHKINRIQNMARTQSQTKIEEKNHVIEWMPHTRINKIQHYYYYCANPLQQHQSQKMMIGQPTKFNMAKKPLSYLFCFSCEHSPLLVFAPLFFVPPFLGL